MNTTPSVTFSYAFAPPYTITLCRPSASEKYILEAEPSGLRVKWSNASLRTAEPLRWKVPPIDVITGLSLLVGETPLCFDRWERHASGAPFPHMWGQAECTQACVSAIAARDGVVLRIQLSNTAAEDRTAYVQYAHLNGWVISNKGWIDGVHSHVLLAMNNDTADRILACAFGADSYPMYGVSPDMRGADADCIPLPGTFSGIQPHSMKKLVMRFNLFPGQSKTGYIFLPYKMYFADLPRISAMDFEKRISRALREWEQLLARGATPDIPDAGFQRVWRACLCDLFVMREKIGPRHSGISPGVEVYRSPNSGEGLESDILLDTLGYTAEALTDYPTYLEGQDPDGCWAFSKGWEHEMWGVIYSKAKAVMTHYRLTGDRDFLETYYARMLASTRFNCAARRQTQDSPVVAYRGLMPRGMGDCGMMNGGDFYGVFYPSNMHALAADKLTLEAACQLGKEQDIPFLEQAIAEATDALLTSVRAHAVSVGALRILPGVPNAPLTSLYGCLYALWPAGLLAPEDPLIRDTTAYALQTKMSEGGLPLGTGWLSDGIWAAMALDNFSQAFLHTGRYTEAARFLYPVANHASPFVTWCEERGAAPQSPVKTGDMQHLWTPLSLLSYTTQALCFHEAGVLHIAAGVPACWTEDGKQIGITNLRTPWGALSFTLKRQGDAFHLWLRTERPVDISVQVHLVYSEEDRRVCTLDTQERTELIALLH